MKGAAIKAAFGSLAFEAAFFIDILLTVISLNDILYLMIYH